MFRAFFDRGGCWVLGQSVLMLAVVALGPLGSGGVCPAAWRMAAWLLILVGAAVGIAGAAALKCNRTMFPQPKPGSRLIQHGIYRYIRHPLYASVILFSLGWAMLHWSYAALGAAAALTAFLHFKIVREERWLREQFPEYEGCSKRVRRLIPWIY